MDNISIENAALMPEITDGWIFRPHSDPPVLDRVSTAERIEVNSAAAVILNYCDGHHNVEQIIDALCLRYPDAVAAIPGDVEGALRQFHQQGALRFVPAGAQQVYPIPDPTPVGQSRRKLCIGMATYDDYDGVYFSVQALRLYHPEVLDEVEILVVDNHPDGPCGQALKNLGQWVQDYRYLPSVDIRGTAVRDVIFREANADFVLCIDSHVMIEAGAIARLLAYFEDHPESRDLLQGPLLSDDLVNLSTHFSPEWRQGMYGAWGYDQRGADPAGAPFDIPMQGLGLFACRKQAWPGFNPRFSGFGGEEGYIHEKVRQGGGRTLCLPFLRWIHRFVRPMGTRYEVNWSDRIRNYMIGFTELGLPTEPLVDHFRQHVGAGETDRILEQVEAELADPLFYFDGLYCVYDSGHLAPMQKIQQQLGAFPAARRIEYLDYAEFPDPVESVQGQLVRLLAEKARRSGTGLFLLINATVPDELPSPTELGKLVQRAELSDWFTLGLERGRIIPRAEKTEALEALIDGDIPAVVAVHSRLYPEIAIA